MVDLGVGEVPHLRGGMDWVKGRGGMDRVKGRGGMRHDTEMGGCVADLKGFKPKGPYDCEVVAVS